MGYYRDASVGRSMALPTRHHAFYFLRHKLELGILYQAEIHHTLGESRSLTDD